MKVRKIILLAILVMASIFALTPILLMFMNSFKTSTELAGNSWGLPRNWTVINYIELVAFNSNVMVRAFFNSVYVTILYTLLTLLVSSLASYSFTKLSFKGCDILFVILLATMMIPREITMPAIYLMFSRVGLLNSYSVQIFPGIANVFCLFMLRQYMKSLPDSLLEAGLLDGAGYWKIFWKVILPISKPAVGAMAILVFLEKWNDYLWPSMLLTRQNIMPIMVILPTLNVGNSLYAIPWNLIMTGCVIVTFPLLVVFLAFQEQFMSSITIGAIKE
ncbi:MAG: carbohydrate ABC transporter permease [Treponema sp.]|jgi:ABC-type glycerol-3-phosphate transport system permease component|nr:carbohydrate ABC transporter permease [Treponema sp.]